MKLKPVDPNAIIRDPNTKLPLPAEGDDVPETGYWTRRWMSGETLKLVGDKWVPYVAPEAVVESKPATPTGREPVTPLTTREGR